MPHEESLYPADWLRLAERDWGRVERLLDGQDPELAGFCLQQAVEKFLKAFLLSHGWPLRRIHDLGALPMRRSSTMPLSRTSALYVRRSLLSTLWNVIPWW
jgi:HEPN domain-containing protein